MPARHAKRANTLQYASNFSAEYLNIITPVSGWILQDVVAHLQPPTTTPETDNLIFISAAGMIQP